MGVGKKLVRLLRCTYNDEICFVCIEPKSIVCHSAGDITEIVIMFVFHDVVLVRIRPSILGKHFRCSPFQHCVV